MPQYINSLYILSLLLLGVCIITALVSICYIIRVVRFGKNETKIAEELLKIKINNSTTKDDL